MNVVLELLLLGAIHSLLQSIPQSHLDVNIVCRKGIRILYDKKPPALKNSKQGVSIWD